MSTEHFDLANYSNEGELKNSLQLNNFDLVLMDYHFIQSKNGAEQINILVERELFKPSISLVFVSFDRMPETIG